MRTAATRFDPGGGLETLHQVVRGTKPIVESLRRPAEPGTRSAGHRAQAVVAGHNPCSDGTPRQPEQPGLV